MQLNMETVLTNSVPLLTCTHGQWVGYTAYMQQSATFHNWLADQTKKTRIEPMLVQNMVLDLIQTGFVPDHSRIRAQNASNSNRNSVHLSVYHTCDPHLNSSIYRNILHTTEQSDVSSFLKPSFAVHSSGVTMNEEGKQMHRRSNIPP